MYVNDYQTDTASVLTEAIGYIQFLHDQVEVLLFYLFGSLYNLLFGPCIVFSLQFTLQTLSVPFMKSSQSKLYRTMQMV